MISINALKKMFSIGGQLNLWMWNPLDNVTTFAYRPMNTNEDSSCSLLKGLFLVHFISPTEEKSSNAVMIHDAIAL
jgi:hypothetical protein